MIGIKPLIRSTWNLLWQRILQKVFFSQHNSLNSWAANYVRMKLGMVFSRSVNTKMCKTKDIELCTSKFYNPIKRLQTDFFLYCRSELFSNFQLEWGQIQNFKYKLVFKGVNNYRKVTKMLFLHLISEYEYLQYHMSYWI